MALLSNSAERMGELHALQAKPWGRQIAGTGFPSLDKAIGGGLFPRLYVLGGDTSTGKTTFALNIANNIAKSGRMVIFFCMEMTAEEMMARSLSRLTYEYDEDNAWTENQILYYSRTEDRQRAKAQESYAYAEADFTTKAGRHLFFVPGRRPARGILPEDPDPEQRARRIMAGEGGLYEIAEELNRETIIGHGKLPPVVVCDYLQIMLPEDGTERMTEREQINRNIAGLIAIKENLQSPVIVVSSYNRSSYYKESTDNSAFKGSGEIEYSSDSLMFLKLVRESQKEWKTNRDGTKEQYEVRDDPSSFRSEMGEDTRRISLDLTKNRGAKYGASVSLEYIPKYNIFQESIIDYNYSGQNENEKMKEKARRKAPF